MLLVELVLFVPVAFADDGSNITHNAETTNRLESNLKYFEFSFITDLVILNSHCIFELTKSILG